MPSTIDEFVKIWFEAKNPAAERVMNNWKGGMQQVRKAVAEVVRIEYQEGRMIWSCAVLGFAKKKKEASLGFCT